MDRLIPNLIRYLKSPRWNRHVLLIPSEKVQFVTARSVEVIIQSWPSESITHFSAQLTELVNVRIASHPSQ